MHQFEVVLCALKYMTSNFQKDLSVVQYSGFFIFLLRIMSNTEINMSERKLKPKWMTDTWFCLCQTETYFYSCQWHWWHHLQNKVIFNARQAGSLKPFQSLDFLYGKYF